MEGIKKGASKARSKAIRKDIKYIDKEGLVDDVVVSTIMHRWDVVPDAIARALGPDYFVFPQVFVQMRDAYSSHFDKSGAGLPAPSAIDEAAEVALGAMWNARP